MRHILSFRIIPNGLGFDGELKVESKLNDTPLSIKGYSDFLRGSEVELTPVQLKNLIDFLSEEYEKYKDSLQEEEKSKMIRIDTINKIIKETLSLEKMDQLIDYLTKVDASKT